MTSADTETMTALQELLDERQRYEGWLKVLDERRSSTPAHVHDRVHTDYSLRLERVTERLAERAGQLSATVDGLTARLDALRARESERTDARQEAELRAAVGEYGPDEWDRQRVAADRELGEMAEQRSGLESEIAELQRVLVLTHGTDEKASSAESTSTEQPPNAPAPEATDGNSGDGQPNSASQASAGATEAVQTPSINDFVAEWLPKDGGDAGGNAATESAPQGDGVPEVPEVDGGPAAAANPGLPSMQGSADANAGAARRPAPRPIPPPAGDTRRESEKTLKCPECGVMNYATEWYCERCGGELSSF